MVRTPPIPVVAAVIRRGNRYLVCQRPAHKTHASLWEFPGGKRKAAENAHQALQRELSEELELHTLATYPALCSIQDSTVGVEIAFHPVEVSGEPQLLEHANLAWLAPAEILDLDLAPSDRTFVESYLGESNV